MLSEGSLRVLELLDCYLFVGTNFSIGSDECNSQHLMTSFLIYFYFGNLGFTVKILNKFF